MNTISLKDVWLKYKIEFKENGRSVTEDFWALKAVSLDIDKGEVVGIIGENGAGKTTMLKLITGMLTPDRGTVSVNGAISAIMEIGAGFQKDLTGKENIYLISSLFGLSKQDIEKRYNDILRFAAIGRFINAPVRIYSQGMYLRLAFAIAIHVNPDILLIDDTFAVGDVYAQNKCINKIFELKEQGKTIIFVTQDMEMAKRLCTKGVFLRDGAIVKQGPMDKLCAYYMESVGDKKGIAIAQKGKAGIIFNNGKLVLRWKDSAITSGLGGYATMRSSGREYLSTTATWQVHNPGTGGDISAIGTWPDMGVSEYWRITFLSESEFLWEIGIDVNEEGAVERFLTSAIFTDRYKSRFDLEDTVDFPQTFVHLLEWECATIGESANKVLGIKGDSRDGEPLPAVIFDRSQDDIKMVCQAGNTGSDIGARAILFQCAAGHTDGKYTRGRYRCFFARVRLFENNESGELKAWLGNARKLIEESKVIRKGLLSLFCREHRVEIYWNGKLITSGIGLNAKFSYKNKNYDANGSHWSISKKNDERIDVAITWDGEPDLAQIWKLGFSDDHTLSWEIDMDTRPDAKIRNRQAELILVNEYREWMTPEEKGDFKKLSKQGNAVVLNKYINNRVAVMEATDNGFVLPSVVFCHKGRLPATTYLSKIDDDGPSTRLRYLEINPENSSRAAAGNDGYFDCELKFNINGNARPVFAEDRAKQSAAIKNGRALLVFDGGKARLFWKGLELTKALGFYSSVSAGGMWYDSSQAFWDVRETGKNELVATGHWPLIPMSQTWRLSIPGERTILWSIEKEIWDNAVFEKEQVNLMLSDSYGEWFTNRRVHGRFPGKFDSHNGFFWDRLWCGDAGSAVGTKKSRIKSGIFRSRVFPSIVLSFSPDCQARYSVIENTDDLFQGRILQCELGPGEIGISRQNKYFNGRINIIT